jgi:hypothetical protein
MTASRPPSPDERYSAAPRGPSRLARLSRKTTRSSPSTSGCSKSVPFLSEPEKVQSTEITRTLRLRGFCRSPLTDSNRRPPPYHGTSQATGGNQSQRIWLVFAVLRPGRFAADCHGLHPRGSIRAPSSVVGLGYVAVGRPRSSGPLSSGARLPEARHLPLVAEWVDDPAEPQDVLICVPGTIPHGGATQCCIGNGELREDVVPVADTVKDGCAGGRFVRRRVAGGRRRGRFRSRV